MPRGLSAREFAIDLKRFGTQTEEKAKTIVRKIALELDAAVVLDTPVLTGRARGNWFPSISIPSTRVAVDKFSKSGADVIADITAVSRTIELGSIIWLTNNLPYILSLENGSSQKAPQGMVDRNVQRIAAHYGGSVTRS